MKPSAKLPVWETLTDGPSTCLDDKRLCRVQLEEAVDAVRVTTFAADKDLRPSSTFCSIQHDDCGESQLAVQSGHCWSLKRRKG